MIRIAQKFPFFCWGVPPKKKLSPKTPTQVAANFWRDHEAACNQPQIHQDPRAFFWGMPEGEKKPSSYTIYMW